MGGWVGGQGPVVAVHIHFCGLFFLGVSEWVGVWVGGLYFCLCCKWVGGWVGGSVVVGVGGQQSFIFLNQNTRP